jgi:hypothetical protein
MVICGYNSRLAHVSPLATTLTSTNNIQMWISDINSYSSMSINYQTTYEGLKIMSHAQNKRPRNVKMSSNDINSYLSISTNFQTTFQKSKIYILSPK